MFATPRKLDLEQKVSRGLNMAKLFFQNKDFISAKEYVHEVLTLKPDSSEAYKLLSQVNEACEEHDLALKNFEKSLELKKMENTLSNFPVGSFSPSKLKSMNPKSNNINSNSKTPNQNSCTFDIDAIKTTIETTIDAKLNVVTGSFQNVKHQLDNLVTLTTKSIQEVSSVKKELSEFNKKLETISAKQEDLEKAVTSRSNDQSIKNELNKITCKFTKFFSDIQGKLDDLSEKVQNMNYEEDYFNDEHGDGDHEDYDDQYDKVQEPLFQNNQAKQPQQALPNLNELSKFKRQNEWTCKCCEVSNNETDLKCVSCEEPRNPGQAPPVTDPATNKLFSTPPNANSGFSFGFKFGTPTASTLAGKPESSPNTANQNAVPVNSATSQNPSSQNIFSNTTPIFETLNTGGQTSVFGTAGQTTVFGTPNNNAQKPLFGVTTNTDHNNQSLFGSKDENSKENSKSIFSFASTPTSFSFKINPENVSATTDLPAASTAPFSMISQSSKPIFSFSNALNSISDPNQKPAFSSSNNQSFPTMNFGDLSKPFAGLGSDQIPKAEPFPKMNSGLFSFSANLSEKNDSDVQKNEHDQSANDCDDLILPKIKLPENYKHVTGEEGEIEVYQKERAKLYILVGDEYKERGVGVLKILKHEETKKLRLLMRRDQVHKVCLNTYLTDDIKFNLQNEKFLLFQCIDFSDDFPKPQTFLLKIGDVNVLKEFKNIIDNLLKGKTANGDVESTSTTKNDDSTIVEQPPEDDPDVKLVCVVEPTPEEKEKIEDLKLPLNFYCQKKHCKGCIGCKDDDDVPWSDLTYSTLGAESSAPSQNDLGLFANLASDVQETKIDNIHQGEGADSNVNETSFVSEKSKLLPENYKHVTGEEDEDVIFKERAKLYRFIVNQETTEYKERGVGEIRILKNRNKVDYRILMRRDIVFKTIMNHKISPQLVMTEASPKSVRWGCRDFSENPDGEDEIFLIKFKDEKKYQEFQKTIKECIAEIEKSNEKN